MTLQTTREEIYRALLESIAFGNRRIIENFDEHGLRLEAIVACGGIAEKSPLTMQLLADTSGLERQRPGVEPDPGARRRAVRRRRRRALRGHRERDRRDHGPGIARRYEPDTAAKAVYDRVYAIYRSLYERLGRSEADLLHGLKRIYTERRAS